MIIPSGYDSDEVNVCVAFGSLTVPGAAAPVTVTGSGASYGGFTVWGAWHNGTKIILETSPDGGATWNTCLMQPRITAMSPYDRAVCCGVQAAGLYRLRLDTPFTGGFVQWGFYQ